MKLTHLLLAAAVLTAACGGKENPTKPDGGEGGDDKPTLQAPAVPTGVKASNATDNTLFFEWNAAERASTYSWMIAREGTEVNSGTTNHTYITVKTLSSGTTYSFKVKAVNSAGESDWSETVTAATTGSDTPGPGPQPEDKYAQFKIPACEDEDGAVRAFPGAEGGGMYTTGGRGGKVIHVTNLNDSGTGSLRAALNETGARTIVFDVAGIIALQSQLQIKNGNVTIAGQTAPGDGICLKNYTFRINASNVIVRYIRCRMGDEKQTEDDAMQVMDHDGDKFTNIIIDHCSISWSTDECASFYGMKDFTFQWNIVSESLRNSVHDKGSHGYGGIWGGTNASYHHNLLAHHDSRNPRIDHDYVSSQKGPVSIFNNVVYNWSGNTCYGGESSSNNGSDYRKYNFFNNYYKPGPVTPSNHIWFLQPTTSCSNCGGTILPGHFYMDGNVMHGKSEISADNWKAGKSSPIGVYIDAGKVSGIKNSTPYPIPGKQTVHTGEGCLTPILTYAGACLRRDEVDARIARETKDGTYTYQGSNLHPESGSVSVKGLIDTQTDVGGWPQYTATAGEKSALKDTDSDGMPDAFEDAFGLNKNNDADGKTITLDEKGRYTNLEMYLHYLVRDITEEQVKGGTYKAL